MVDKRIEWESLWREYAWDNLHEILHRDSGAVVQPSGGFLFGYVGMVLRLGFFFRLNVIFYYLFAVNVAHLNPICEKGEDKERKKEN